MFEMTPLLVALISFVSVAAVIFVVGRYMVSEAAIQRRLPSRSADLSESVPSGVLSSLAARVDEKRFGIEGILRTKLRRDLIRAGYFSNEATRIYVIARLGLVLVLPTITYIFSGVFLSGYSPYLNFLFVAISALLGIVGVDGYISRRQRILQQEYRIVFPDLIDMLVVCIDAGLGLDAAFARVLPEVSKQSRAMGINLTLIGSETRAGRSMADALDGFADRLSLDEARAFVIMLRQSLELGTDINDALRVFSDEMRAKRLLRAEENANKLPVKMVIPLGACIFPVILMVIMVPVMIKLTSVFSAVGH